MFYCEHLFTGKLHLIVSSSVTGLVVVMNLIYLAEDHAKA